MAEFLDTSATSFYLEHLIKHTQQYLWLISPYLQFNQRIKELLADKKYSNISIHIVYGKSELTDDTQAWLASQPHIHVGYCQNLHAKCYINETTCIIGSMNLYEFSQANNNEMGVLLTHEADSKAYADAQAEACRILRISTAYTSSQPKPTTLSEYALSLAWSYAHSGFSLFATSGAGRDGIFRDNIDEEYCYLLTTAKLAEFIGITTAECNTILQQKGFQTWQNGRFYLTELGKQLGAVEKQGKYGEFIVWRYYDQEKNAGYVHYEDYCDWFNVVRWIDADVGFAFAFIDESFKDGAKLDNFFPENFIQCTTEHLAKSFGLSQEQCNALLNYKGLQQWNNQLHHHAPTKLGKRFGVLDMSNSQNPFVLWNYVEMPNPTD